MGLFGGVVGKYWRGVVEFDGWSRIVGVSGCGIKYFIATNITIDIPGFFTSRRFFEGCAMVLGWGSCSILNLAQFNIKLSGTTDAALYLCEFSHFPATKAVDN